MSPYDVPLWPLVRGSVLISLPRPFLSRVQTKCTSEQTRCFTTTEAWPRKRPDAAVADCIISSDFAQFHSKFILKVSFLWLTAHLWILTHPLRTPDLKNGLVVLVVYIYTQVTWLHRRTRQLLLALFYLEVLWMSSPYTKTLISYKSYNEHNALVVSKAQWLKLTKGATECACGRHRGARDATVPIILCFSSCFNEQLVFMYRAVQRRFRCKWCGTRRGSCALSGLRQSVLSDVDLIWTAGPTCARGSDTCFQIKSSLIRIVMFHGVVFVDAFRLFLAVVFLMGWFRYRLFIV